MLDPSHESPAPSLQDTLTMDLERQFPLASSGHEGIAVNTPDRSTHSPGDEDALSTPPTTEDITVKDKAELTGKAQVDYSA
jgi:hypothetical protein